jgi:methylated-DNA-[protein]-cysteine S-methyltransferase
MVDAVAVTRVAYTVDGWGEGELWFEGATLLWHELPQPRSERGEERGDVRRRAGSRAYPHPGGETSRRPSRSTLARTSARVRADSEPEVTKLLDDLDRYFRGERVRFEGVTLMVDGTTAFQRALVDALRAIPWGEVVSYRELARSAGYPNAQRAAGTFCAQNRFPLVLPCHRVVSSDGVGNYGSLGVAYKRRLLELEGVAL